MEKSDFLIEDKIAEIQREFRIPNGWLKIYENSLCGSGIYCCLISNDKVNEYNQDEEWPIEKGREGKPAVYGDNSYETYHIKGVEPFLFYKSFEFPDKSINYIDVAEEFILYFNLYEDRNNKENRIFYYVNDYGKLDEVLIVEPDSIRVKIKYLKEYITIRDMNFIICYDFMRKINKIPKEWNICYEENLVKNKKYIYTHIVKKSFSYSLSWIRGKFFIKPDKIKKKHFDLDESKNQDFIIGTDDNGELIYKNCNEKSFFEISYFDKEVLTKYYTEPNKYKIDGFSIISNFFVLKIDNNKDKYVAVFLSDLRILSYEEQLHWKQYNIPPESDMNISDSYYQVMVKGELPGTPEAIDLLFKSKYLSFNEKWEKKFGWKLYKPFHLKDENLFFSLHRITSDNEQLFRNQTLTVVKLTIDRLNEEELSKSLVLNEKEKGISKFIKFLNNNNFNNPDIFAFIKNLQSLRSGLIAHSFSETNKDCKKAIIYFNLDKNNYSEIFENILKNFIFLWKNLENHFNL